MGFFEQITLCFVRYYWSVVLQAFVWMGVVRISFDTPFCYHRFLRTTNTVDECDGVEVNNTYSDKG
jgi:hypothetical protein